MLTINAQIEKRQSRRSKLLPRWLIWPSFILLAIVLLVVAGLMSRECRIARVVLADDLPSTVSLTLSARHGLDGRTILWRGPVGTGPILIPFAIPGDGKFEAKVEDPTGPTRVEEFGHITSAGATHYIFIGRDEIIHSEAPLGALRDRTGEISTIRQVFSGGFNYFSDVLSCVGE